MRDNSNIHENHVDELALWVKKLEEEFEGFLKELDSKLKIRSCNIMDYTSNHEKIKSFSPSLFENLKAIGNKKNIGSLDEKDIKDIKNKIKDFDSALNNIERFIGEEMYGSKLQYIILKLKSILFGIANYFLSRDLQYSRVSGYGEFAYISSGPVDHITPVYILPDRPKISLFFSEQIYKEIDKIGKELPQLNCN